MRPTLAVLIPREARPGAPRRIWQFFALGQRLPRGVAEVFSQRTPTPMRLHGLQESYGESGQNDGLLKKHGLTPTHVAQTGEELQMQTR